MTPRALAIWDAAWLAGSIVLGVAVIAVAVAGVIVRGTDDDDG